MAEIKYYSKKLEDAGREKFYFDSEEECVNAEAAFDAEEEAKLKAIEEEKRKVEEEKAVKEARKAEVDEAYKAMFDAQKKFAELSSKFADDYGHLSCYYEGTDDCCACKEDKSSNIEAVLDNLEHSLLNFSDRISEMINL